MRDETYVRSRLTARDMALAALFAVLTGVGAQLRVPLPFVPITLQTPVVLLAGLLLGSRGGALSMFLYLFIGLIGMPVFSGGGGPQSVLHPTFGFLVGFIPAAWIAGKVSEHFAATSRRTSEIAVIAAASVAAVAAYDVCGLIGFYLNLNYVMGKAIGMADAVKIAVVPFIIPDAVKTAGTVAIAAAVRRRFRG